MSPPGEDNGRSTMPNAISTHYADAKLPAGCTVDDKIDVFEDWMNGWLLLHAYALPDEAYKLRADAGFAISGPF